jgi:hypothetical protein
MPRKFTAYEPDAIDCNTVMNAIANDFGLLAEVETRYHLDTVTVIVRCRSVPKEGPQLVQVQALASAPLKTAKSLYIYHYAALLDCWHQCDRRVLAVRGVDRQSDWNGRPQQPAKHVRK